MKGKSCFSDTRPTGFLCCPSAGKTRAYRSQGNLFQAKLSHLGLLELSFPTLERTAVLQGPVSFGDLYAQFTLSSVYSVLSVD